MYYKEPLLWEKQGSHSVGLSINDNFLEIELPNSAHLRSDIKLPCFSEPDVVRHFTKLSTWNYSVDIGAYPLGSCTMKYNPKLNEKFAGLKGFTNSHPKQSTKESQGVLEILYKTSRYLEEITGMDDSTLQPAAGAHGELTAMFMFRQYHKENSNESRDTILIPDSAHGTNPASAALCGFKVKTIKSNNEGIITPEAVSELIDNKVAGLMITNPGTLGIFEPHIKEICDIVHKNGGLVYGDGANLNALLGIIKVGNVGIDAIHLNLHKTFSTPHGGGGPGAGPVCVKKHLSRYLPNPRIVLENGKYSLDSSNKESIGKVHGFYGNFSVILKAFAYILTMGNSGLKKVSQLAVLNANYVRTNLKDFYNLPFKRDSLHEVLFNDKYQNENNITTLDIAKGMIERGIHPPTIYFPLVVHGALLLEPTESESLESLDNLINIMKEIAEKSKSNPELLHNAPIHCNRCRVDETLAARKPILRGYISD